MNYNFENFTDQSFKDSTDIPSEIKGSGFGQTNNDPDPLVVEIDIFPSDIVCTFTRCDMTNVKKHPGMTYTDDCQVETTKIQRDGVHWHTDKFGNPLSPKDSYAFDKLGISKDPKDIINSENVVGDIYSRELA